MILFCSYTVSLFIRQVWTGPHIAFFNFLFSLIRSIAEWHKHAIYLFIFFLLIWWSLNHRPHRLIEGRWTAIREVKSQWVCVGCGMRCSGGGGRVVRILQSLIGVIRSSLSWKNQNPPAPTPLPQVMNNDRPPFSYLFIVFFLILLLHLFIYSFFITFFTKEEYQKELFYLAYLEGLQ